MTRRQPWFARGRSADDGGTVLIMVVILTTIVFLVLATASTTLITQMRPTKVSQNKAAATAAAYAGIEDFIGWVNTKCPAANAYTCSLLTTGATNKTGVTDTSNQAGVQLITQGSGSVTEYTYWKVQYVSSGFARVLSVGQVPSGKANPQFSTVSLIADVNATPSFNNLQFFTKYETYSSEFIDGFYGPRTVEVTAAADVSNTALSGVTKPGAISWAGVCDATTNLSCDPSHDSSICDDLYYASGEGPGRGTDTAWSNVTRRPPAATQLAMGTDSTFSYYAEAGSYLANGSATAQSVTHNDTCDTSFEPNMVMNGPVYSQDTYLVDRGQDTGNSQNSMPNFADYAYSVWNGSVNGTTTSPGLQGGYYRSYPGTNGQVVAARTPFPTYTSSALDLPPNAASAPRTCTYTGPTRVLIQGAFAYITSPGTPATTGVCYTSTGGFSNVHAIDSQGVDPTDTSGGVVNAKVPVSSTSIYIKNAPASVPRTAATPSSPIFTLATTLSVPAATIADTLTGTWTTPASYPSAVSCPLASANVNLQRNFDCETGLTANPRSSENVLANVKASVDAILPSAPTATALTSAITSTLNTTSQTAPTSLGGFYYTVSVGAPSTSNQSVTPAAMSPSDAFFQRTTGAGYTAATTSWAVTINRNVCTKVQGGSCTKYDTTAIVAGSLSKTTNTAAGSLNSSATFPWFGAQSGSSTYTDVNNDITTYYHGYGDAYVQGTLTGQMSILAEHDVLITNDLVYSNTNVSNTSDGLALVANHNVRIYRPMTCTDNGTAGSTTKGTCPNDLTGLLNSTLSWPLPSNLPSKKYVSNAAPSLVSTGSGIIDASIFALRGSFLVDNFYRGAVGFGATITGGLYQYHRGPTSLPYQNRPYQGSGTKMPGISLTYNYDNLRSGQTGLGGLRVPWIPSPDGNTTGRTWNTVSVSSR